MGKRARAGSKRLVWLGTRAAWPVAVGLVVLRVVDAWSEPTLGYDLQPIRAAGQALAAGRALYQVGAFVYPPSAALVLGRVLAVFGFGLERHVALGIAAASYAAMPVVAARAAGRGWFHPAAAAGTIVICLAGFHGDLFILENVSVLVALVCSLMVLAWARGDEFVAGALLGLTLALKPMLAPLVLGLVVMRRWRALGGAIAVPALLNAVTLLVDHAALHGMSSHLAGLFAGHGSGFDAHNGALVSIGRELSWPLALTVLARVLVACAGVATAVAGARRGASRVFDVEAAGLLTAAFFVAGSLYEDHFVLVLVPFAYACLTEGSTFRSWTVAALAVVACCVIAVPAQLTSLTRVAVDSIQRGLGLSAIVVFVAGQMTYAWWGRRARTTAPVAASAAP